MRGLAFLFVTAILIAAAPAAAGDIAQLPGRQQNRAFWLNDQPWPMPQMQTVRREPVRFTTTYTEGVAKRFGVGTGRLNLFERDLSAAGREGPALVGTLDGGAAKLVLRWRTDD